MKHTAWLIQLAGSVLAVMLTGIAHGATLVVNKTSGPYNTIAAAITASAPNDIIQVTDSETYIENATLTQRSLVTTTAPIIQGGLVLAGPNATVRGFAIYNPAAGGYAISTDKTHNATGVFLVDGCCIVSNDVGIRIQDPCTVNVQNTTIKNTQYSGIRIETDATNPADMPTLNVSNTVIDNSPTNNTGDWASINVNQASNVTLTNSIISSSKRKGIVTNMYNDGLANPVSTIQLNSCLIRDSGESAIQLHRHANVTVDNTIFSNIGNVGIYRTQYGNDLNNPARTNITVQNNCVFNYCRWGLYFENPATVNVQDTTIEGSYYSAVYFINAGSATAAGSVIAITNCNMSGNGWPGSGNQNRSSVYSNQAITLTATNSVFSGNQNVGIWRDNGNNTAPTNLTVTNCTFDYNSWGIINWSYGELTATNCAFRYNSNRAISANTNGGTILFQVTGCDLIDGSLRANNVVEGNNMVAGSKFVNNLVQGGYRGIYTNNSNINIINNTFVSGHWDIVACKGTGGVSYAKNNIVYGDGPTGGGPAFSGDNAANFICDTNLVFNCIYSTAGGWNNGYYYNTTTNNPIVADPLFVSVPDAFILGAGDYALRSGSPAIAAGLTGLGVTDDFEGHTRPTAPAKPMLGCYETIAPASRSAVVNVPAQQPTLTEAMRAVTAGGTIRVAPTYTGSLLTHVPNYQSASIVSHNGTQPTPGATLRGPVYVCDPDAPVNLTGLNFNLGAGAVRLTTATALTMTSCTVTKSVYGVFLPNLAASRIDGAWDENPAIKAALTIDGCSFNQTGYCALNLLRYTDLTFNNSSVMFNGYNGAISMWSPTDAPGPANVQITNSSFAYCKSENGGALYLGWPDSVILSNCQFTSNIARSYGGGIFAYKAKTLFRMEDCDLIYNVCYGGNGGGLRYYDNLKQSVNIELINCRFHMNAAYKGSTAWGGGLIFEHDYAVISATLDKCVFTSNIANNNPGGACAFYAPNTTGSTYLITNSRFEGGYSANDTGGVYFNVNQATSRYENCVFANNNCVGAGAALRRQVGGQMDVVNCTFNGNWANATNNNLHYDGVCIMNSTPANFVNCIFDGHDSAIFVHNVRSETRAYNCLFGPVGRFPVRANTANNVFVTNPVGGYPSFTNTSLSDYTLQDNSAAINAGVAAVGAVAAPALDIRGLGRVNAYDLGAYENQNPTPPPHDQMNEIIRVTLTGGTNPPLDGTSWDKAMTLVNAMAAVVPNGQIWMQAALDPGYPCNATLTSKSMSIYGGFVGTEDSPADRPATYWQTQPTTITMAGGVTTLRVFEYNTYGGYLYLDGVHFSNINRAKTTGGWTDAGAVAYGYFVTFIARNCNFYGCQSELGAVLASQYYSFFDLSNCEFWNNQSRASEGGAVKGDSSTFLLSDCRFFNNNAFNNNAGALHAYGAASSITLTNCGFYGNSTGNTGSTGDRWGGAVFCQSLGNPIIITDCWFEGNKQYSSGQQGNGGALGISGCTAGAFVSNCNFIQNQNNRHGGAMRNDNTSVTLAACNFINNDNNLGGTTLGHTGGAILFQSGSGKKVYITSCTFANNRALGPVAGDQSDSGAVSFWDTIDAEVTNCVFDGNQCSARGGAICQKNSNDVLLIANCLFRGNTAGQYGGALRLQANAKVVNCTFVGNRANTAYGSPLGNVYSDGMMVDPNGAVTILNSIFDDHDMAIYANTGAGPARADNCLLGPVGRNLFANGVHGMALRNRVVADPLFINAAAEDYRLDNNSQAIGASAASAYGINAPAYDLNMAPRDNGAPDIGAFENPNAAPGTPPAPPANPVVFVKRGATGTGASWSDATDLASALVNVSPGGAVYVAGYNTAGNDYALTGSIYLGQKCVNIYGKYTAAIDGDMTRADDYCTTLNGVNSYQILAAGYTSMTLDGLTFYQGLSGAGGTNGGALCLDSMELLANNCEFINNTGSYDGGAIMMGQGTSATLTNCRFLNNHTIDGSNGGGGAFSNTGLSFITMDSCVFSGNFTPREGGAIRSVNGFINAANIARNCVFDNNRNTVGASPNGGGVARIYAIPWTFVDCVFTNNYCTNGSTWKDGGAINAGGGTNMLLSFTNCLFQGNTGYSGGGVRTDSYNNVIANCQFIGNRANNTYGGGYYKETAGTLVATDCIFRNNTSAGEGGGLVSVKGTATIANCVLDSNTAGNGGGAARWYQETMTITSCTFINNTGNGTNGGGAIWSSSGGNRVQTYSQCQFIGNRVGTNHGGAFKGGDGYVYYFNGCLFTGNQANGSGSGGGAIEVYSDNTTMTLTNCILANNTAAGTGNGGGAILCWNNTELRLINCTIVGNRSNYNNSDGVYFKHAPQWNVKYRAFVNTVFDNSAYAIRCDNVTAPAIQTYNCLFGLTGRNGFTNAVQYTTATGSLSGDPAFVNPASNWDIMGNSAAINQGLTQAQATATVISYPANPITIPTVDVAARLRNDGTPDCGAYEMLDSTLTFSPTAIDFGAVTMNTSATTTVIMTAGGNAPAVIDSTMFLTSGLPYSVASAFNGSLPLGSTATAVVQFEPAALDVYPGAWFGYNDGVIVSTSVSLTGSAQAQVTSITLLDATPTSGPTARFLVEFAPPVENIDVTDFAAVITGGSFSAPPSVLSVSDATGVATIVTVNVGLGIGQFGLSVAGAADIRDVIYQQPLANKPFSSDANVYNVDNNGAQVTSIIALGPDPTSATTLQFAVTFDEAVAGVSPSAFTFMPLGAGSGVATSVSGGGVNWVVTVDTVAAGGQTGIPVRLDLTNGSAILDWLGNPMTQTYTAGATVRVDQTAPGFDPMANVEASSGSVVDKVEVTTVTFNEPVTGLTTASLTITTDGLNIYAPLSVDNPSSDGITYVFTMDDTYGSGPAQIIFEIAGGAIYDRALNPFAGMQWSVVKDVTVIPVLLASTQVDEGGITSLTAIIINAHFSSPVSGFDPINEPGDVTTDNCTVTAFSGSGQDYLITVTPVAQGLVALRVPAGACHNAVPPFTRINGTSNIYSFSFDSVAPSFTSFAAAPARVKEGTTVTMSCMASEPLAADAGMTVNGHAATLTAAGAPAFAFSYVVQAADAEGSATLAAAGYDLAGNLGVTNDAILLYVDKTPPTATVSSVAPDAGALITVTFSEAVTGVDIGDFVLTRNGVRINELSLFTQISPTQYTMVSGNTTPGVYNLQLVAAGSNIQDLAHIPIATDVIGVWGVAPAASAVRTWTRY